MSRQIPFFADPEDSATFHAWLLNRYPGLTALAFSGGFLASPSHFEVNEEFLQRFGRFALVLPWSTDRLTIGESRGRFSINWSLSPVMEYSRSILDEEQNRLVVGRLYWAFEGSLSPTERQDIDRLFRWIRYRTMPIPSYKGFRVFRRVCENARTLDYGFGIHEPCPLWQYHSSQFGPK